MTEDTLWSVPVRVDDVPAEGTHLRLAADAAVRERIVRSAGLVALLRLEAAFDLARRDRDGLRVTGTVSAEVEQTCVVTLEPVRNAVREQVELAFSPAAAGRGDGGVPAEPAAGEPEPLEGGTVDLGALAVEFLMLGIDPYPRKPGAVFEPPADLQAQAHPFAALAALKPSRSDKG